jgi:hypothetical protein
VINQLTIKVSESSAHRPVVCFYGSPVVGLEIITAIKAHSWLSNAVEIGGFVSSTGQCKGDTLQGYPWRSSDRLLADRADFVVVASESSRLAIQEELSRLDLLARMVPAYGMRAEAAVYERDPQGPGQSFTAGATARDYATRELIARTSVNVAPSAQSERLNDSAAVQVAA